MKKRPMTKGFFSIPIKSTCIFYQEQPLGVPPSAPLSEAKDGFRLVLSEAFIFPSGSQMSACTRITWKANQNTDR